MKNSLLIGAMLGMVAATAVYSHSSHCSLKRAKRALAHKIEDILG